MDRELPYRHIVSSKIESVVNANRDILNHSLTFDENEHRLRITLTYDGFDAVLSYSDVNLFGYTFLENQETANQLVTDFIFPFSKIPFSIYDVHNAVEDNQFDTYNFHCLYNQAQVLDAMDTVILFISRNLARISAVSRDVELRTKLEQSFDSDLAIVSKKLTREKMELDVDKYYIGYISSMYYYRAAETVFTNHANSKSVGDLQRFYSRQSKINGLLTYEKRYLDHLYENDFEIANQKVHSRVRSQEKAASKLKLLHTVSLIAGMIIAVTIDVVISAYCDAKISEHYFSLTEQHMGSLPLFFNMVGAYLTLYTVAKQILLKRSKSFDGVLTKSKRRLYAVAAVIGVVIISVTSILSYFTCMKAVAVNENEVYYCTKIGKAETLSYDEVHFYLIEGEDYYGDYSDTDDDKRMAVVINDDYNDYQLTDYFSFIDDEAFSLIEYEASFKDIDAFRNAFGID